MKKRLLKKQIVIPVILIAALIAIFGGWYLLPSHPLDVVVLDKTVPSRSDTVDSVIINRKHYGLFWMLNQLKYTKVDSGNAYDYLTDYYGVVYDQSGIPQIRSIAQLNRTPDVLYLSDVYGSQALKVNDEIVDYRGLSYEDIASASTANLNGSTVIFESDALSSVAEESVLHEVETLCGVNYTAWTGRYITDMSDLTDIPEWAPALYETQYGRTWDCTGAGILMVSSKGELVILNESDFNGSMLTVSITNDYQKEFGRHSLRYYNWFVIVTTDYQAETIAEFHLNLNEEGIKKFSKVSDTTTFPAVVRTKGSAAPAYFFAGDFNDYVANARFSRFLFSEAFYRFFSYDRPGDITYSYWNFYYPLMKTILGQADDNRSSVVQSTANTSSAFRILNNRFEVCEQGEWKAMTIKGFDLNAVTPGTLSDSYTRDIAIYHQFLSEISKMGGNAVRVYDLLPPEFYRALYEYNHNNPTRPLYFFQTITTPKTVDSKDALSTMPLEQLRSNIEDTINAVHGNVALSDTDTREGGAYITDVSAYLMGYLIQTDTTAQTLAALTTNYPGYHYTGEYLSCASGSGESLSALLCDTVYSYEKQHYGYISPVGASGNAMLVPGAPWSSDAQGAFNLNSLTPSDQANGMFFVSYELQPTDNALLNNEVAFASYTDSGGSFPYGGYLQALLRTQTAHPVLIDRLSLSTNVNAYEKETSVNGLTETQQGQGLVRMLQAVQAQDCLGGLIGDYNDNWSLSSDDFKPYIRPLKDNPLWQNVLDPTQCSGVASMEPEISENEMVFKDSGRMNEMHITSDATYFYMTLTLDKEIDYDTEQLMIGLDTYQRNNGEYLYDPAYFATSLSGMEFVIKFESKNTAALYVVPSYNRDKGGYSSAETYNGLFDYVCQLNYGSFETSYSNFYSAGSTVHIRIPWNLLNITDPTAKLVINDTRTAEQIAADVFGLQTTPTDGILSSVLIADKESKDSLYIFPKDKQSSGYKYYTWKTWDKVRFTLRQKESCKLLSEFFLGR